MWLVGMIVEIFLVLLGPGVFIMLMNNQLPFRYWEIFLIQLLQSAGLLAVSICIGVTLASKVNLHTPCFEALVRGDSLLKKLRPQFIPGCIGGLSVGIFFFGMNYLTPPELNFNPQHMIFIFQILHEVLHGGVTQEIFLRWGMMTLLLWFMWRFIQRDLNKPSQSKVWIAIIVSSLLFGLAYLPLFELFHNELPTYRLIYIIVVNTLPGLVFGFLYKQYGLESAMIAHALVPLIGLLFTMMYAQHL